ncbi:hypothetical protein [Erythrobacter sp. EC-HK427]|uniref:hypothetical protein n=1 Tax=Erythrobacter sp. EC-HK427 TaxID=2038396 RepID=UPI001F3014DA|nr:hypothetical protein [Erythrobacter sp. EC-HK427]
MTIITSSGSTAVSVVATGAPPLMAGSMTGVVFCPSCAAAGSAMAAALANRARRMAV